MRRKSECILPEAKKKGVFKKEGEKRGQSAV